MKRLIIASAILLFLSGCAKQFYTGMRAESHQPFPNANIEPLGRTTGEASTMGIGFATVSSKLRKQAYANALSKVQGANILVNFHEFQSRSSFLFIETLTLKVEGTAAYQEIGTQELIK